MTAHHPPQRSFQPRRRKLGPTRREAYEDLRTTHGFAVDGAVIDWAAGAVLDIGFGYGAALIELAGRDLSQRVIGVEVHTPGVANVLEAISQHGWQHVRVVEGDVLEFLPRLGPSSLAGVRIWFPDPWPKTRQQRRRLVRPDVVAAVVDRLRVGGFLHLATDIAHYAGQMQLVCEGDGRLQGGVIDRPAWRPVTGYEQRGMDAGRHAVDLMYVKV